MKVVAVRAAKEGLSSYIDIAQQDRVLITRHGRPAALLIGVDGEEMEDLMTMANPRFWEMIEARRRPARATLSLAAVKRRLGLLPPVRGSKARTASPRKRSRAASR